MENLALKVSEIFNNIAQILELNNDNPFRIRAYLKAASAVEPLGPSLEGLIKEDRLETIPGVGKDLSEKIKEIANSGKLKFYEDLRKTIPEGVLELLKIPSLGPKTVKLLYSKLNIKNIQELEQAARSGKLLTLEGIKEKTVSNILAGIEILKKGRERISLAKALSVAQVFLDELTKKLKIQKIIAAGSLRRMQETVRDIDILLISKKPRQAIDTFTKAKGVKRILASGDTKASILNDEDIQIDLRVVPLKSFGAALLYFTGSKNFNIKLRQLAGKLQLTINEYGVFSLKDKNKFVAGRSEAEIFKVLGLEYVEPELRQDWGEVELAQKHDLPQLIHLSDIKGDLHVHSNYSDGAYSILEMVQACRLKGYEYVAITDHSQSLKIARGLSKKELINKKLEIDKLNKKFSPFRILYATEVDIDSDGNMDYPDSVLAEFDVVVAAIHTGFKQTKQQLTRRLIKACQNKYINIIAHPTGRLWQVRDAYEIDLDEILKVAKQTNTALEINSFPDRLDLNDINCRQAKLAGVKVCINTDSHDIRHLDFMHLGVATARRGWLSKTDCLNALSLDKLLKELSK